MNIQCPICKGKFTIDPRRKQTHSNILHKLLGQWCREMGDGFEVAKVMFKFQFGTWIPYPFEVGLPDWPGRFAIIYEGTPDAMAIYLKSESAYSKAEEHALLEGMKAACFDAGLDTDWMED